MSVSLNLPLTGSDSIFVILSPTPVIRKDSKELSKVITAFIVVGICKHLLVLYLEKKSFNYHIYQLVLYNVHVFSKTK